MFSTKHYKKKMKMIDQDASLRDLLHIELTISFLIGRKRAVNFQNKRLWRHLAAAYRIIIAPKVTDNHAMYDRGVRVITSRSRALCYLASVKKQKHDFCRLPSKVRSDTGAINALYLISFSSLLTQL